MSKPKRSATRAGKRASRRWRKQSPANGAPTAAPRAAKPRREGSGTRLRHFYDVRQYAVLTDVDGKILILQLPKDYDERAANTWTLPGGKLEPTDEPGEGLLREIAEETGLQATLQGVCAVGRWATRASKKLAIFYRATVAGHQPDPVLSGEHQRAVWVSLEELPGFPFHRTEMAQVIDRVLGKPAAPSV